MLGKTRRAELQALFDDYLARIRHYADIAAIEQRDSSTALRKLQLDPTASVSCSTLWASSSPPSSSPAGSANGATAANASWSSFAATPRASPTLRRKATLKISLTSLTLSHELARVVLAEQLYRALAALAGHPYPK